MHLLRQNLGQAVHLVHVLADQSHRVLHKYVELRCLVDILIQNAARMPVVTALMLRDLCASFLKQLHLDLALQRVVFLKLIVQDYDRVLDEISVLDLLVDQQLRLSVHHVLKQRRPEQINRRLDVLVSEIAVIL